MSVDQKVWFEELSAATPGLLVLGTSSLVNPVWEPDLPADVREALGILKLVDPNDTTRKYDDRWDAYPAERAWLLGVLSKRAPGTTVLLGGDVHSAFQSHVRAGDQRIPEWTTSSVTSQNIDDKMGWEPRTKSIEYERQFVESKADFDFCDFDSHGFLVVSVEPGKVSCEWWAVSTVLAPEHTVHVVHESSFDRPSENSAV